MKRTVQQQRPAPRPVADRLEHTVDVSADAVDRVLDKISSQGMESLTAMERAVLDEMARLLRKESRQGR